MNTAESAYIGMIGVDLERVPGKLTILMAILKMIDFLIARLSAGLAMKQPSKFHSSESTD